MNFTNIQALNTTTKVAEKKGKQELSFEELLQKAHALQDIGRLEESATVLAQANKMLEKVDMTLCEVDVDSDNISQCSSISSSSHEESLEEVREVINTSPSVAPSVVSSVSKRSVPSRHFGVQEKDDSINHASQPVFSPTENKFNEIEHAQHSPDIKPEKRKPETVPETRSRREAVGLDTYLLGNIKTFVSPLEAVNIQLKKQSKAAEVTAEIMKHENEATSRRTVTKAGNLLLLSTKSVFFKAWKQKFIILSGRLLLIFKNAKSTSCEKVLELPHATVEAVSLQLKAKHHNMTTYEFRIKEQFSDEVHRFRLLKRKDGETTQATDKENISNWVSCVKNNILISNNSLDVLESDLSVLRELHDKTGDKSVEKESGNNKNSYSLFRNRSKLFNNTKSNKGSDWRNLESDVKLDVARKINHFATKKDTQMHVIGHNVGERMEKEDIFVNYKLLNVVPTATDLEIKRSYRSLARDYHPDKNINNEAIEERTRRFAAISQAFNVMKFKETRAAYDLCENVKELLRQGIIVRLHLVGENPKQQILFVDAKFLNLFIQDVDHGTVLSKGFRTIELRFVTHIYRGADGFAFGNRDLPEAHEHSIDFHLNSVDTFLTLHGDRLGQQDWHIQTANVNSRNQLLEGLRKLRCDNSELFKQRLGEMFEGGLT